ncbi:MAG TPA: DUF1801 domain-containing protein [Caulobacter sp.]|nr:DUF1801 domain-containing protein [Caulobacter sp.]
MARTDYGSVDAYIAAKPEALRPILQQVRAAIGAALPDATEVISYQMPAYRTAAGVVAFFAGWKAHYSLYPVTETVREAFGDELAPYGFSKGTLKLPLDAPVPTDLIGRLARAMADAAAARQAARK